MLRRAFIKLIGIVPGLSLFSKINSEPTIIFPNGSYIKGMKFTEFHSADYYMGNAGSSKTMIQSLPYYNDNGTQVFTRNGKVITWE